MTFTTAAASEMRERIGAIAGKATAKELMISTFHSFSLQLCRSHAEKLCRSMIISLMFPLVTADDLRLACFSQLFYIPELWLLSVAT